VNLVGAVVIDYDGCGVPLRWRLQEAARGVRVYLSCGFLAINIDVVGSLFMWI
jgi:hypothetical protein